MLKTNDQKFLNELREVEKLGYKPKLLLHSCCGPCGCYPILLLSEYFDLTVYFNNSNIYPKEEFDKRLRELKKYIDKLNKEEKKSIKLIVTDYLNEKYNKILSKRKDDPEGSYRCFTCYSLRYKDLVEYAEENGYEYVCSVMTISRHKNEKKINKILEGYVNKKKKVKVLHSNFKKRRGAEIGDAIAKENKMYRQNYCGCIFSLNNQK